ncbi:MAG TPA: hypothetical protein EYH01_05930 [Campylobacterales bacterium]|nr:hypothetical protein [Campylobacterales bacterium]HIP59948.1 hypothetical protein [Campylobacterales bacterium]
MRVLIKIVALLVFIFSSFMVYDHYEMSQKVKFEALNRINPIPKTIEYIEQKKYADAAEYLEFFMDYDYVRNDPKAWKLYSGLKEERESYEYQSKKVMEGVLYGKSDETIGQVSAGISDFFLFGDLRDLTIEGWHKLTGKEVDNVLVGLSTIGVVATGATVMSGGSAAPVKGGVSLLKFAKKAGKMPKWLEKFVIKNAKQVKKTKDIKPIKSFFEDIYNTTKASNLNTTMKLMSNAPNLKAFKNSLGFAKAFGKKSGALTKILGKDTVIYYRVLKDKTSKKAFLNASTYGEKGIKRLAKTGEKGFLKSLKAPVKVSRLTKVLSKNSVDFLKNISVNIYILTAMVSLVFFI